MTFCAHKFAQVLATLLQFVDGQEILSALLNSLPLFHFSSCRHGPLSYFTGCACFFGGVFVCVFGLLFGCFFSRYRNLVCNSIFTRLR